MTLQHYCRKHHFGDSDDHHSVIWLHCFQDLGQGLFHPLGVSLQPMKLKWTFIATSASPWRVYSFPLSAVVYRMCPLGGFTALHSLSEVASSPGLSCSTFWTSYLTFGWAYFTWLKGQVCG